MEHPENNEKNEKQLDQKSNVKFKIMSLKVKAGMDYVPELVSYMALLINNVILLLPTFGKCLMRVACGLAVCTKWVDASVRALVLLLILKMQIMILLWVLISCHTNTKTNF